MADRVASGLCVLRGGGDLATGVAWRMTRAGWSVVVLELADPLTVRRTVALSTAVVDGVADVEGMVGRRVDTVDDAVAVTASGDVAVLVSPALPAALDRDVVVDARLAKRNIDTTIADAPLVVALGPGFTAGRDCHAVVETMRGHRLGRVIRHGAAAPDTGTPGRVGGWGAERVVRAPASGPVRWRTVIGAHVDEGALLGHVAGRPLAAPLSGVVRGLIRDGAAVTAGLKIGDLDPRADPSACFEISDKSLAVGGGVVEAVLAWRHGTC